MWLPKEIEQRILALIEMPNLTWKTVAVHKKRLQRLRKQMYELSDDYVQSRFSADTHADAYFAYNFPMNFMKAMIIGQRVKFLYPQLMNHKNTLRILDIGCGEGAAMFGLYYGLKNSKQFVLTGFDQSSTMLKRCRKITSRLQQCSAYILIKLKRQDVSNGLLPKRAQKYDVVILANSLAEIFPTNTIPIRFIERIFKGIHDNGIIIIIEPALKHLSRRLMYLRREILQKQKGFILLPCLHEKECSLIEIRKGKEWCHESISWRPPEFMKILNQGLNREINRLKLSYLVISKQILHKPRGFLVISSLLREKGKKRCYLCTADGLIELARLNKHKTKSNEEFDSIKKGNIITLEEYVSAKQHYWQITKQSKIHILFS